MGHGDDWILSKRSNFCNDFLEHYPFRVRILLGIFVMQRCIYDLLFSRLCGRADSLLRVSEN